MSSITRRLGAAAAAVTLAAAAACGGADGSAAPGTSLAASPTAPSAASPGATPRRTSGGPARSTTPAPDRQTGALWTSGPTTVVHRPAVPPVPVVVGVRSAAHPREGYDRIVVDVRGPLPGYTVRYVDRVLADPSDRLVAVPGRRFLLLVLSPAQAHGDDGRSTVSGVHRLDLPMMRGWAVVGDHEGYVSVAVGLDDVVGYRTGELPGRVFLDVAA